MRRTASVLFLLLALTTSAWAQTTTFYVDDDYTASTTGWGTTHFDKIQDAIDAASNGDEIRVAPGTYTENANWDVVNNANNYPTQTGNRLGLLVNKSVSIIGVDASDNPITSTSSIAATVTSGMQSNWGTNFLISAEDVTIRGLELHGTGSGAQSYVNKAIEVIDDGFTLEYCIVGASGTLDMYGAVYINDYDASGWATNQSTWQSAIASFNIANNILRGSFSVTNGPGTNRSPIDMRVTGNSFVNSSSSTVLNAGFYVTGYDDAIAWRIAPASMPTTITGNTFDASIGSLFLARDDDASRLPTLAQMQSLLANNTFGGSVFITQPGGSLRTESDPTASTNNVHIRKTIQTAIDAATAGDILNVGAGLYAEGLSIGKSVSILGPNASISPNTGTRAAEAILRPTGGSTAPDAITGTAANIDVVFKGFTVDMLDTRYTQTYDYSKKFMAQTGKTGTTWTFEHNIFKNADYVSSGHWLINGNNNGLVFNLLDNLFTDNGISNGLSIWDTNPFTINAQENVWEDNGYTAMNLNNVHGVIANNIFRDTRTIDTTDANYYFADYQSGVLLANPDMDLQITGNMFNNVVYGISLYENVGGNISISDNTFDGTITASIRLSGSQNVIPDPANQLTGVVAFNNKFLNHHGMAISSGRHDTELLDARHNWWGDNSGPYHTVTNSTAAGAEVADYVLFEPWTGQIPVSTINTPYTLDSDQDGYADINLVFNTVPSGGGNVYISRYSSVPPQWPAPPTNALTNTYVILTTDMPNYQFDVNVVLTYLGSGFGANTQAAYYNEDTEEWVIIGGTFTDNGVAGPSNDDTYSFRTNHFTPFVFINTPSTPLPLMLTDMMVSDAYDESTIPSTPTLTEPWQQWMGGGNLTDDWSWEYQNSTVSVIPMTVGADIFAATVTLRYNPADWQLLSPTGYTNGTKVGSLFTTPNYSTFFYQLPGTVSTDNTILADVSVQEAGNPMGTADGLNSLMDFAFKPIAANPSPITFLSAQVRDNLNQAYYLDLSDDSKGRIYLGDFVASSTVHNMGDGLIDIDDLTVWSISYFSDVSGVTYPGSLGNYKLKYDVGPTSTNYIDGMPEPDGKIEFEDLVIFAISYGLSSNGSYPKAMASQQLDLTLVSSAFDAGEYVDVPVRISGATDLRALSMTFTYDVNALTFDGAVHGSLVGENTPMFVQDRDGSVRIDVASFNEQGISGSDDLVVLRFRATRAGKDAVRLENALARDSRNAAISLRGASTLPETMTLEQNYPNPFNPSTNIRFSLPEKGGVELAVFDMLGRKVRTLVDATMSEGSFTVSFDGLDDAGASLPSGVYIYRLVVGERVAQRSMMLSK